MPDIRLGLLDFNWVGPGRSAAESLRDTFLVARRAEALGYHRFWVGEHHLGGHACGSPQVLAGILAAQTRRLRIGVGAMLLQYWSPLKLAEDFRLLEAVFGRIDLGVGRGRADDLHSHRALLDGRAGGDGMLEEALYGQRLDELLGHLRGTLPALHPHQGAPVLPELALAPEVWVCGSEGAATQAARTGTAFCCTLFHGRMVSPAALARYRAGFVPGPGLAAPRGAIAVCGVCAETDAAAQALREAFPHRNYLPSVVGSPGRCRDLIRGLCLEYGVDEVILLDLAPDGETRLRSLELLAGVMAS
jgi:luciferase family oxidoreductase group 1